MLGDIEKLVFRGDQRIEFSESWVIGKIWWKRWGLEESLTVGSDGQEATELFRFSFKRNRRDASIFHSSELVILKLLDLKTKI